MTGWSISTASAPSAFHMRARTEGLRDFGACMSPQNAFYILQGVETLPLRIERHIANTKAVVAFLAGHDAVAYVVHPSLPSHADHRLAKKLLPKGAGSMVSFGVKGGGTRAAASSRRAGSPRTSPMSATPRPWSSTRRRPRISRSARKRSRRPASART